MLRLSVIITISVLCGAVIGATSFAIAENFFGRGIGIFTSSPVLAAINGIVLMGMPSLVVGIIVGSFKTSSVQSLIVGLITALVMLLWFVLTSESKYFYENGYFDKQLFCYDVIINITWLIGLPIVAMIVWAQIHLTLSQNT